ncbi:MAG: response regulator [Bacillus subtilis]|nr:response regulator [Bacillus subtilis]
MLPDVSGFHLCTRIRQDSQIPILFVSAKGEEMDRILGIELGGDDYLTKPFSGRELAVRVKALLRRSAQAENRPSNAASSSLGNLDLQTRRTRHRRLANRDCRSRRRNTICSSC